MLFPLFGESIKIKDKGCAIGSSKPGSIAPSVNLFVKVTDACNAHCRFCSNAGKSCTYGIFNLEKLSDIIKELQVNNILVNRINITGGEPSVVPNLVNDILLLLNRDEFQGIHVHLNTNGLLPESKELMRHSRWDSISISLHHYNRDKLSELYGKPTLDNPFDFSGVNLDKVNASCNLIKGYIDDEDSVEKMMRFAIGLSLPRLGFVALMKTNDYCIEHYIDFSDVSWGRIPHLYFTESRNRGEDCKCSNYLYNHDGKILEIYMRNYINFKYCESSLLYDGTFLRQGFHDDNIIF